MEAGEKEEEETLQTAFKKLRVDAETSLPGTVNVCEALDARAVPRTGPETSGAKPKLGCTKDHWHGCMRKTSRGVSRTQRRRRSKSPILHPPKFTYCSSCSSSLSPPGGCLKHQRLAAPEPHPPPSTAAAAPTSPAPPPPPAQTQPPSSSSSSSPAALAQTPPAVFGACAGGPSSPEAPGSPAQREGGPSRGPEPSDFHALSVGATGPGSPPCSSCSGGETPPEGGAAADRQLGCVCAGAAGGGTPLPGTPPAGWPGVEVYSFTGLRGAISECERSLPAPRTPSSSSSSPAVAGAPRSCSEQARAYADDINIEDLSGYMEYFLYIPKKMSHMAEMMYT